MAFVGNQEGATISRGAGKNFLPPCVRHTLAHLLASLVFALLVLLEGGQITFAGAGEGGGVLLLLLGERKQRGSVTTVTFTLYSVCYPAFRYSFLYYTVHILFTENLSVNCELYSPTPI